MQHAILFFYFIVFSFGIIVMGVSAILAFRSKSAKLSVYFVLLAAYSLNLFTIILDSYSRINMQWLMEQNESFWIHFMMFTHFFLMFSVLLLNRYFSFNGKISPRWIVYAIICVTLFAYDWLFPRRTTGFRILYFPIVDLIFFGSIAYVLIRGFTKIIKYLHEGENSLPELELQFFKRLQFILLAFLPFVLNDDLHFVPLPIRFSPILYAVINFLFLQLMLKYYLAHYYVSEGDIYGIKKTDQHPVFIKYGITDRERETIFLVLKGYSNRKISDELCVSLATVKTHIYNIFKKTGIKSRFELISMMKTVLNK